MASGEWGYINRNNSILLWQGYNPLESASIAAFAWLLWR